MRSPLPKSINPERLAIGKQSLSGNWPAPLCKRLEAAVHRVLSDIELDLEVTSSRPGQYDLKGQIRVELELICQRCLQPAYWLIEEPIQIRAAGIDTGSREGSGIDTLELDPDGQIDMQQWLEDEILLKLPLVASHKELSDCDSGMLARTKEHLEEEQTEPNPFAVLKQLKD